MSEHPTVSVADAAAAGPTREARTVQLLGLALQFSGREDIFVPVPPKGAASVPFTLKEGTDCRAVVRFRVDGPSVTGLKIIDVRSMSGVELGGREVLLGDFRRGGPYELALPPERVPSGPRARGLYDVYAALIDAEGRVLDRHDYRFEVKRDWETPDP
ncbi:hypothetical protein J7E93_29025 [Streptomyces sp. ISL-36]|uniref:rho GDP-dissociation inhibitor n=1 Tax=Streptomyces sp. ISL-36 TaxID=2819182 RepID=UPI001BEAC73E|nr:rho GDP-dissociation inhibitor [Streptomyces sp. ISL-36]MBT2444065.1 hypothetical protein [Streptomyces sp. ISL-36]